MKILRFLLIFVVIIIGILYFAFNPIAKYLITNQASKTLHTPVTIYDLQSSLGEKSITINLIEVQNPANFKAKNALSIEYFSFALSDETTTDLIVIENLMFDRITATMEQNDTHINLKVLSDNLDDPDPTEASGKNTHDTNAINTDERRVIIKHFTIANSEVIIDTKLLKETISLPTIVLTNIGDTTGIKLNQIGSRIMAIVLDKLQAAVKKKGLDMAEDKLKKTLTRKLSEKLGLESDSIDDLKESANEKVNKIKDKIQNQIGDKLKNIFKF